MVTIQNKLKILSWLDLNSLEIKSNCSRKSVGSFLIDSGGKVVSTGYNTYLGTSCNSFLTHKCPRHSRGSKDVKCPAIHAEVHSILNYLDIDIQKLVDFSTNTELVDYFCTIKSFKDICKDFFIFCSYSPCPSCMKLAEYVGISDIFCLKRHSKTIPAKFLDVWLYQRISEKDCLDDYILQPFEY